MRDFRAALDRDPGNIALRYALAQALLATNQLKEAEAELKKIIETAADNAKKGNVTRIRATGHADRSGPEKYNMRLSMRRAQAVKAELVRLGIAEKEITLVAKGETEPLVPTPDGVREPQNRRVEILFE